MECPTVSVTRHCTGGVVERSCNPPSGVTEDVGASSLLPSVGGDVCGSVCGGKKLETTSEIPQEDGVPSDTPALEGSDEESAVESSACLSLDVASVSVMEDIE